MNLEASHWILDIDPVVYVIFCPLQRIILGYPICILVMPRVRDYSGCDNSLVNKTVVTPCLLPSQLHFHFA